jgi:ribosome-binding protein aMBF1 (putative translation factor)
MRCDQCGRKVDGYLLVPYDDMLVCRSCRTRLSAKPATPTDEQLTIDTPPAPRKHSQNDDDDTFGY